MKKCRWWEHDWTLRARGLTVPMFDCSGSKGELWECSKCGELKAK